MHRIGNTVDECKLEFQSGFTFFLLTWNFADCMLYSFVKVSGWQLIHFVLNYFQAFRDISTSTQRASRKCKIQNVFNVSYLYFRKVSCPLFNRSISTHKLLKYSLKSDTLKSAHHFKCKQ